MSKGGRKKRRDNAPRPKVPRQGVALPSGKQPRLPVGGTSDNRPSWRFVHCDHGGRWGWDWTAIREHLATLIAMEETTWPELAKTGTIGSAKLIPLDKLCREAQRRLEQLKHDDAEALWELRLGGKPRIWGIRLGDCLHFLWWDPDHTVCPSTKGR